jgi:hypothetical protein
MSLSLSSQHDTELRSSSPEPGLNDGATIVVPEQPRTLPQPVALAAGPRDASSTADSHAQAVRAVEAKTGPVASDDDSEEESTFDLYLFHTEHDAPWYADAINSSIARSAGRQ